MYVERMEKKKNDIIKMEKYMCYKIKEYIFLFIVKP